MHKQKLKHLNFRICTHVFCSTRKKESNNIRTEWQNEKQKYVKTALGSACMFRSFSLSRNKKQIRNRLIKEANNLKGCKGC